VVASVLTDAVVITVSAAGFLTVGVNLVGDSIGGIGRTDEKR
jgi:hypothetical protein